MEWAEILEWAEVTVTFTNGETEKRRPNGEELMDPFVVSAPRAAR